MPFERRSRAPFGIPSANGRRASSRRHSRGAFTFIEVLFAVIILGVGMIMIAGMLPVAIKQTADTRNDLTAKIVCDTGYAYIRSMVVAHPEAFPETCGVYTVGGGGPITPVASSPFESLLNDKLMSLNSNDKYTTTGTFPTNVLPTAVVQPAERRAGRVVPLSYDVVFPPGISPNNYDLGTLVNNEVTGATLGRKISAYPLAWHQANLGDRIGTAEPRFQWLAFYRRDEGANSIKVIIIAMRQQNGDVVDRFDVNKTMPKEGINTGNGPFLTPVEIEDGLTEPDKVKFVGTPGKDAWDNDVAESGAFLIIAHSPPKTYATGVATPDLNRPYRNNGRVFRLAAHRTDLEESNTGMRIWELAPGFDLAPAGAGPDGVAGTADDVPDGSMNTSQVSPDNTVGTRAADVATYPVGDTTKAGGTTAWAWIIGRGRLDPTAATNATPVYAGPTQDLGVLTVDIPLK